MSPPLTIERKIHFRRGRRSRKEIRQGEAKPMPKGRVPRISRLLALAIRMQELLDKSEVASYAEAARTGHVSRARISQVMALLNLCPSIQEELLFLPRTGKGRDPISEHAIRPIAAKPDWGRQRGMWKRLSQ